MLVDPGDCFIVSITQQGCEHLKGNMNIHFRIIKTGKIVFYLIGAVFILSAAGYAEFHQKNFSSTNRNLKRYPISMQIVYKYNNSSVLETSIQERLFENRIKKQFSDDNLFFGKAVNLKESAQQMMEQALMLCQLSQEYWHKGDLDRAIELLDQAYLLIVGVNPLENENLIQQKEDLRITISRRLIEIYASRKIVVNGSQNEIPVNINEKVQFEIDLYTTGRLRKHFIASYKRSGKYRQMIVDMLEEENLPKELSWLPLVESGFKAKALSKMRALGLWQFIPSTGYKFGLSRNRYIDERLDPSKSTRAAVNYLKELHNHFGDWSTVLAAYNCGENRVFRVIRKQKIKYLDNFWDLYEHLPRETARYVPKFLAILHIVNNLEKYGLDKIKIQSPLKFEPLTVSRKIHLEDAAEIIGIDSHLLEELNPELRQSIIPGGNYPLKIPLESKQILLSNINRILRLNPALVDFVKHRVKSGDTLSRIARRYHTSITNIMLANNLQRASYIVSGKTLKIPQNVKPSFQEKIGS